MRRRRRLAPKPEPPPGMMFARTGLIPIEVMEDVCKENMIFTGIGFMSPRWDNDTSYFWADKLREKKQNEQP